MASNTPFKPKQDTGYKVDEDTVNSIIKKRFNTCLLYTSPSPRD